MSSVISNLKSKVKLTRGILIGLIIASFIGFIIFTSFGGSQTNLFGTQEEAPEYEGNPDSVDLPRSGQGGFNFSDFGEPPGGLNPPADLVGDAGSIGSGGLPDLNPPDGDQPPSGGEIPDIPGETPGGSNGPGGPGGGINWPEPPSGDGPDFNNPGTSNNNGSSGSPLTIPDRPNKAKYLWNLSSIELFPNTNFSISINLNFPEIPVPGFDNIAFFALVIAMLYLPQAAVSALLSEISKTSNKAKGKGESSGIFFKPEKTEAELKREEERKKMLLSLADHISSIIDEVQNRQEAGQAPKDIINWTYLTLDEAFASFMTLKRNKDLTPLEHAQLSFESHEINNDALAEIVDLFYRTRFGNKSLGYDKIERLVTLLSGLVLGEETNEITSKGSRWSIFR